MYTMYDNIDGECQGRFELQWYAVHEMGFSWEDYITIRGMKLPTWFYDWTSF